MQYRTPAGTPRHTRDHFRCMGGRWMDVVRNDLKDIAIVLAGARNEEQALENAKSVDIQLTNEEVHAIDRAVLSF